MFYYYYQQNVHNWFGLNSQPSGDFTNLKNYATENVLLPTECTQLVGLNSQPSGDFTNLTNYVTEHANPSNENEWIDNSLTNPLSTQLINEFISLAPLDTFQQFTDMTCVNKQSSDNWINMSEYELPTQTGFQLDNINDFELDNISVSGPDFDIDEMDIDETDNKCQWAMQALLLSSNFMDTQLI